MFLTTNLAKPSGLTGLPRPVVTARILSRLGCPLPRAARAGRSPGLPSLAGGQAGPQGTLSVVPQALTGLRGKMQSVPKEQLEAIH